jgi:hypothetical protein
MDLDVTSHDLFFTPFFPHSVNIVSASTNQGKSTLLQNIIKNRNNCFTRPFNRVVVIFCNEKVDSLPYTLLSQHGLDIEIFYLEDFSTSILEINDLVIFEDIVDINPVIKEVINILAHHKDLATVFVVCQCVYDQKFKVLLSLAHQVLIFLAGTQGTKLANHIRQYFFISSEIKEKIKSIISNAEKYKEVVLFKLNDIARPDNPPFLAIEGIENFVTNFVTSAQTLVYPELHKEYLYKNMFDDNFVEMDNLDVSTIPKGSYLLVPAANVIKKSKHTDAKAEPNSKQDQWHKLNLAIIDEIKSGMQYNRQRTALNIAKYMLNSKDFTFSKNGRSVMISNEPDTLTSTVDYLDAASRMSGPNEPLNPVFVTITKLLIQQRMPKIFVKNKNLLYGFRKKKKPVQEKRFKINNRDYFQQPF